jgi:hypothetical protein
MAANAVLLDLLLGVETNQRELRVHVVIEGFSTLATFNVTLRTWSVGVLPLVDLLVRMTAGAFLCAIGGLGLALVTGSTGSP